MEKRYKISEFGALSFKGSDEEETETDSDETRNDNVPAPVSVT